MCWTPLCANKQNNNVNKTCALLQTNGGRTEHRFYAEIVTDINVSNNQELIGIMYLTIFKLSITDKTKTKQFEDTIGLIRILDKTKTKQFDDTKGLIRILDKTKTKQFEGPKQIIH